MTTPADETMTTMAETTAGVTLPAPPVRLGTYPTPVHPVPRLAEALGLGVDDLWLKRDDLIGLGGGGNKVRKLEYSCTQALAAGATTVITTGAAQSNHARLTAAAAARLGMACVLVLQGPAPEQPSGNVLLDLVAGARLEWCEQQETPARLTAVQADVRAEGGLPFVIPFGGSSSETAMGYVDCAREMTEQLPDLATVVVAVGSGGTMAGLVAGLGADRVIGVHTGAVDDPDAVVTGLLAGMPDLGHVHGPLQIVGDQVGSGYASITADARAAIRLVARTEGVFLDPTYTGRAMAGLVSLCASGTIAAGRRTVFVHSGGLPGLLAHPEVAW
jgi:L-cysteate sulfo-lyase